MKYPQQQTPSAFMSVYQRFVFKKVSASSSTCLAEPLVSSYCRSMPPQVGLHFRNGKRQIVRTRRHERIASFRER